jgi:CRP/FNR family cyclic AMP-dependent transcriptional regulator
MSEEAAGKLDVICRAFACPVDIGAIVLAQLTHRSFPSRSTILWSDDAGRHVYLVFSGRARAVTYSVEGHIVLIHVFEAGDIFGESRVLGRDDVAQDVIATAPVEAGLCGAACFIRLMENHACMALAVSRLLIERLSVTTRRMVEISTLSAAGRIHAELLRQARRSPELAIEPFPILSEFALLVQTTRETASRTINDLERSGIIRREPGRLKVVAPHRLEDLII